MSDYFLLPAFAILFNLLVICQSRLRIRFRGVEDAFSKLPVICLGLN